MSHVSFSTDRRRTSVAESSDGSVAGAVIPESERRRALSSLRRKLPAATAPPVKTAHAAASEAKADAADRLKASSLAIRGTMKFAKKAKKSLLLRRAQLLGSGSVDEPSGIAQWLRSTRLPDRRGDVKDTSE